MARIKRRWCKDCDRYVGATWQGGMSFGLLSLALSIATAGLYLLAWLVVRFLSCFLPRNIGWVCPNCGRRV